MRLLRPLLLVATLVSGQATQQPLATFTLDQIPSIGIGTWNLKDEEAPGAVSYAIRTGYRHVDAAAIYRNEKAVGKGIAQGLREAGLGREHIWVTSKLWNDHHAPDKVEEAIEKSLSDLGLEYLDLYLVHWPVASSDNGLEEDFIETWRAMTQLVQSGKARHIGVANFSPAQLQALVNSTSHPPSVHQFETHPYLQQTEWIAYHKLHGIHVTAYSPFAGTNPIYGDPKHAPPHLLDNKAIQRIADDHDATPAQVALAWGLSRGTSIIPKSAHVDRISENFASSNITLDKEDYEILADLGEKFTHRYNNPGKNWGLKLFDGLEDS